jgi:Rieske Fe-S protein
VSDDAATGPLTTTAAIPVGGGTILPTEGVVITQPAAGEFVAFSTTCPHRGCTVRAVAAGTINCFCHGSRFSISDGSVAGGPATQPLRRLPILVADGVIRLG